MQCVTLGARGFLRPETAHDKPLAPRVAVCGQLVDQGVIMKKNEDGFTQRTTFQSWPILKIYRTTQENVLLISPGYV